MKRLFALLIFFCTPLFAIESSHMTSCLSDLLSTADNNVTVGELKQHCQENKPDKITHQSALKRRQLFEKNAGWNAFSLLPHKPNYIIASYNNSEPNKEPFEATFPTSNVDLQHVETKFQLSVKIPIIQNIMAWRFICRLHEPFFLATI